MDQSLARFIDHTNLKPTATETDIRTLCGDAIQYPFKALCVAPYFVPYVKEMMEHYPGTTICTVIGFPLGYQTTTVKLLEAEQALECGALEIDMVINLSAFKSMAYQSVQNEIQKLAELVHDRDGLLKVIIETAYLDDNEIRIACELCAEARTDFVKTSTGFAPAGAVVEQVRLMRSLLPETIEIKASGGIKTRADVLALLDAGATRIGTSSGVAIMEEV
ncbi:deoxyribose-phosphate aldolase [Tellurirhabdus rosea]|uniref:deoxyribose-phosphate aldolase n=1 Tax=Tellurirhabdus rosea TaxID=2674997 RepID=UPI0022528575|nr:deoxyribose-phosphate aldolase [Tellurirhabdus rosea]